MGGRTTGAWVLAGISVFGASCAPQAEMEEARRARAQGLAQEIVRMAPATNRIDAEEFSAQAVDQAARQREEWGVELNPWLHNGLVNLGMKPAGLCYQWSNTLYSQLDDAVPPGLKMTLVKSNPGSLREHHAISLHKDTCFWSDGILLDGWEEAGRLVYMPIAESRRSWEYESEETFYVYPKSTSRGPETESDQGVSGAGGDPEKT